MVLLTKFQIKILQVGFKLFSLFFLSFQFFALFLLAVFIGILFHPRTFFPREAISHHEKLNLIWTPAEESPRKMRSDERFLPLSAIYADFYYDRRRLLFCELSESGSGFIAASHLSTLCICFFFFLRNNIKGFIHCMANEWMDGWFMETMFLMQKVCMTGASVKNVIARFSSFFVRVFEISAIVCCWR